MDVQRMLLNLALKKNVAMQSVREKADDYVNSGHISREGADAVLQHIEDERKLLTYSNVGVEPGNGAEASGDAVDASAGGPKSRQQLEEELRRRENMMKTGEPAAGTGVTDQWRVYKDILAGLEGKTQPLRMIVQASAGTGKSFLLSTVALWCLVHGRGVKACAPTGIAAANVEVPGTRVSATTIHNMWNLDTSLQSKLDLNRDHDEVVKELKRMEVNLVDEFSMIDVDLYDVMREMWRRLAAYRKPSGAGLDEFGDLHIVLFGDLKQLPPATRRPPFIAMEGVPEVFDVRVLTQNRRVVDDPARAQQINNFHHVLQHIAAGQGSDNELVRQFFVEAYANAASEHYSPKSLPLEGNTAIFTKRRYRDKWNGALVSRLAKHCGHELRVQGQVRARFNPNSKRPTGDRQYASKGKLKYLRGKTKTQYAWSLRLAGDWHPAEETKPLVKRERHMMRVMLLANINVPNRFSNGAQGRLAYFQPDGKGKTPVPSFHEDVGARFIREASLIKREMVADVDHIDIGPRQETLVGIPGNYALEQLPIVPAYGLTVHKSQALSIKHEVLGCLEGVFALGQIYVLVSRVTDPANLKFIGLPPKDLLDDVAMAVEQRGVDVNGFFEQACLVTGEFQYERTAPDKWCHNVVGRLKPRLEKGRTIPTTLRALGEVLNPQEIAMDVIRRVLQWMDRVDESSWRGLEKPAFRNADGTPIFPEDDDPWWLTNVQRRAQANDGEHKGSLIKILEDILEDGPMLEDDLVTAEALAQAIEEDSSEEPSDSSDEEGMLGEALGAMMHHHGGLHDAGCCPEPCAGGGPIVRPRQFLFQDPRALWAGRYFECQNEAQCGLHALNNIMGRREFEPADLERAVASVLQVTDEAVEEHVAPSGWYSHSVLAEAVQPTWELMLGRSMPDSRKEFLENGDIIGVLLNVFTGRGVRHWSAICKHAGEAWRVDSLEQEPELLNDASWHYFLERVVSAFPLRVRTDW